MAIVTTVAGPYSGTYDPQNTATAYTLGQTEDGFKLRWKPKKSLVMGTAYAETVIDAVYTGMEVFIGFTSIQSYLVAFDNTWSEAAWPYAATGRIGTIGLMDVGSSMAGTLTFTAAAGTTAATAPASLTAVEAMLREDFEPEMLMASRLRKIPVDMRLYPYDLGSSVYGFFSFT